MTADPGCANNNASKHIFLVEDHPIMREMLISFLEVTQGFEVCGSAESAEEAIESLKEAKPDLVLVDVSLPEMSGIDLVRHIRSTYPELPCLMLSGHGESSYVKRALQAGARGYVLKDDSVELPTAILTVLGGDVYLSKSIRSASNLRRQRPRQRE